MAGIGATLREARMRQRIDITDMEVETKIRTKYLRALENEEWEQLPGPAYVKSFLRTYADALGLDGRRTVEEYKLSHERPADGDLHPIRPVGTRDRGRRGGEPRRGLPRWVPIAVVLAGIVAALYALGRSTGGDDQDPMPAMTTSTTSTGASAGGGGRSRSGAARRRGSSASSSTSPVVRLKLVPTAPVSVCLVDARGRVLVRDETLTPGSPTPTFRSRRFRLGLGNANLRMIVDGRARTVPASSTGIFLELTRRGRRALPPGQRPSCA